MRSLFVYHDTFVLFVGLLFLTSAVISGHVQYCQYVLYSIWSLDMMSLCQSSDGQMVHSLHLDDGWTDLALAQTSSLGLNTHNTQHQPTDNPVDPHSMLCTLCRSGHCSIFCWFVCLPLPVLCSHHPHVHSKPQNTINNLFLKNPNITFEQEKFEIEDFT